MKWLTSHFYSAGLCLGCWVDFSAVLHCQYRRRFDETMILDDVDSGDSGDSVL